MISTRNILITLEEGFYWFALNIVIPLVPVIFFAIYTTVKNGEFEDSILIPSLLLFTFALLVTGVYMFYRKVSAKRNWGKGLIAWVVLLGLTLGYLFTYYLATPETKEWIDANLILWRILFFISIATIIGLNCPEIKERIDERIRMGPYKEAEDVGQSVEAGKEEIKEAAEEVDNGN